MSVCPNKNLPEWKSLVETVGEFEAYRDFMETNGEIRTPEVVVAKLDSRNATKYQHAKTTDTNNVISREKAETVLKALAAKFGDDYGYRISQPNYNIPWKGKVEPASAQNGWKRTVVINPAYATLDTPMHEFGHIFIDLIKANFQLYGNVLKKVTAKDKDGNYRDKDFAATFEYVKSAYTETFKDEIYDITDEELETLLEEEAIVELLGQYAAQTLDPATGIYKKIQGVWDAIIKIIKDIITNGNTIDVIELSPNLSLEQLANILANPEIKIIAGASQEQRLQSEVDNVTAIKENIVKIKDALKDPSSVFIKGRTTATIYTGESAAFAKKLAGNYDSNAPLYRWAKFITNEFGPLTETIFTAAKMWEGSPDAFLNAMKRSHKDWFFSLKDKFSEPERLAIETLLRNLARADSNDIPWQIKNQATRTVRDINTKITHGYNSESYRNAKRALERFSSPRDVVEYLLSSTGNLFENLFPKLYTSETNSQVNISRGDMAAYAIEKAERGDFSVIENEISRLDTIINKIKNKEIFSLPDSNFYRNRNLLTRKKEVEYNYKDANGVEKTDNIKVSLDYYSNGTVSVSFGVTGGDRSGYSDQYTVKSLKASDKVRIGKTELGLKSERVPEPIFVPVEDRGDSLVVAHSTYGDVRYPEVQPTQEIKDAYKPPHLRIDKYYLVPKADLVELKAQAGRGISVMNLVAQAVTDMIAYQPIQAITFTPVSGKSLLREEGELRSGLYSLFAKKLFGKHLKLGVRNRFGTRFQNRFGMTNEEYNFLVDFEARETNTPEDIERYNKTLAKYEAATPEYTNVIPIPEAFKTYNNNSRTLFQKVNDNENTVPFIEEQVETLMGQAILNDVEDNSVDPTSSDQAEAVDLAKELSGRLGIDFQIVTAEEALSIVETAGIKYNGEPAFFVGGIAYFVGTNLTTKNVLHEFSHPFVRNIAKTNPTLFNRLYNQVLESNEGKAIRDAVLEDNPSLDPESDYFKEEVLVRALTKAGLNKLNSIQNESAFAKAIKNILYAIKQALRKAFGKNVKVSNLDVNTTMDELAEMLVAGGQLQIDKSLISEEDFVAFNSERQEYIEDLIKIEGNDAQQLLNQFYDTAVNHIRKLLTNRNYDELAAILTDEDKRGDLQELKSNLQAYQTTVANMAGKVVEDMEFTKKRSTAFVNSLFRLDTVMQKILLHVKDIQQNKDSQEALAKAYYYDHLLKHWSEFIKDSENMLDRNKIERGPLNTMLNNIKTSIRQSKKLINEMYADGARDALYEELLPMQESLKLRYDKIIQNLKDKNAPQSRIDREHQIYYGLTEAELREFNDLKAYSKQGPLAQADYNRMKELSAKRNQGIQLTPEKMEALLRGDIGDANFYNSYLEGYLYNTDPVIGGLAVYVKNKLNDVMAKIQAKQVEFFTDMEKPLQDAGFNPLRIGEIGKKMGFLDKVAKREKDGSIIERLVWSFLNPFKNYRYDYDVYRMNVEQAKREYNRTGSDVSRKAMIDAIADQQVFMRNYFNQEYVDEFYEREKLFEKDDIGKEAMYRRKEWGERLRALIEPANTQSEQLAISDELDQMWREYRQMRSMYNLDGTMKTGMDLEVAKRLAEYHELSRKFYEFKPRKGVFQNALKAYKQELIDSGVEKDSDRFKAMVKQWISKNTVTVPKQSWYEKRAELYKRKAEILSKLPNDQNALREDEINKEIFDLMGGFRDEENQTKATEMSPESRARVIELEKELKNLQEQQVNTSGLTKQEFNRWMTLGQMKQRGEWNQELAREYNELWNKKNRQGLSKFEARKLKSINTQLSGIQERLATDYYVDIMNNWLGQLNTSELGVREIDQGSAEWLIQPENINKLLGQNAEFDKWFKDNHLTTTYFKDGQEIEGWSRSRLWSITVPTDLANFETFDITNEDGTVETIMGKPKMKYFSRVVKSEYKNDKIVGVTVDNKYNWLPKSREKMAASSLPEDQKFKYINEEYYALEQNDPKTFAAMEKMKEHHLANQDGLSYKGRLYYDFPRLRKSTLETIQDKNALTIYAERIKDFFRRAKDDAESGFNYDDQENLVRMDMFDNTVTNVPIAGLYDIDHQDVSLDLTTTLMQYMLSAERQKQLVEISPLAKAVQSVVNASSEDIANTQGIDNINKMNFYNRAIRMVKGEDKDTVRKKAINNYIAREFEGQRMTGAGSETPWLNNTASLLFKRASFGFFALNIPSALKNSWGAKFQGLIEASAGQYMTHTSFQRGNVWSYKTMGELSFGGQLYRKAAKSLNQQLVELFDPSQGRFEEKFGESMSRTIAKDAASFSWLYNFRKWVELQATLQIFGGMMYHQMVEQTMPDGTKKEIYYIDAWELKDNKIQLKEGVDPKWGVTYDEEGKMKVGKEFKAYKNKVHQVMNNLQGAYAQYDQPEAQRYLAFRFLSYLRRYFTTMTLNRFGFSGRFSDPKPRFNPGLGEPQMGFYITFIRFAKDTIFNLGKNLPYMTEEEKRASLRMITEVGSLLAINLAMSLLFGWDPDDDDKYERLRQKSGPLPFPFVSDDPDREFNGWGYLETHMLYLLMNVRAENEQFIPLPGYGLDDYSAMLDLKSIAFGPTVQTYKDIFEDALDMLEGDESAYYKRQVGPYDWQDEGGAKILAHTARTLGLTGSTIDPVKGIKGFQSVQARAR